MESATTRAYDRAQPALRATASLLRPEPSGRTLDHLTIGVTDLAALQADLAERTGLDAEIIPHAGGGGLASLIAPINGGGAIGFAGPTPCSSARAGRGPDVQINAHLGFWTVQARSIALLARAAEGAGQRIMHARRERVDRFDYVCAEFAYNYLELFPRIIVWPETHPQPLSPGAPIDLTRFVLRSPDPDAFNKTAEALGLAERAIRGDPGADIEIAGPTGVLHMTLSARSAAAYLSRPC